MLPLLSVKLEDYLYYHYLIHQAGCQGNVIDNFNIMRYK
jgi:hypothetical protein